MLREENCRTYLIDARGGIASGAPKLKSDSSLRLTARHGGQAQAGSE